LEWHEGGRESNGSFEWVRSAFARRALGFGTWQAALFAAGDVSSEELVSDMPKLQLTQSKLKRSCTIALALCK
jgi:hypothetical protein